MSGALVKVTCAHCGARFDKRGVEVRRRRRVDPGYRFYCGRTCFGLARRVERTISEKKARKAAYDLERRNGPARERILAEKRERHRRTYTYESGRAFRASRPGYHTEYCRKYFKDPERKAAKIAYDRERRSALQYGPFADAAMLLVDLEKEIRHREPDKYERAKARGYYERTAQQRKRNAGISKW